MRSLAELISRHAQDGRVCWIGVRPRRRGPVQPLERAMLLLRGFEDDHGTSEKRAVTLVQHEHLAVIGALLGRDAVDPVELRRNLSVSGLNLAAMRGRQLAMGDAVLEVTGICAPCSRMEETFGSGGYTAVRGHGGFCARVLRPGHISLGDTVKPITSAE